MLSWIKKERLVYDENLRVDYPWPRTSLLDFGDGRGTQMDLGPNCGVHCQCDPSKKLVLRGNPFSFKSRG